MVKVASWKSASLVKVAPRKEALWLKVASWKSASLVKVGVSGVLWTWEEFLPVTG